MNLKKKFVIGAASVALVASMGGVAAPAAVADVYQNPGFANNLGRLAGADRVGTSLAVAAHEFGKRSTSAVPQSDYDPHHKNQLDEGSRPAAKRVYLASADEAHLIDAASAGMLVDGPIVFVSNNVYVGTAVGKFLRDAENNNTGFHTIKEIVPIGGTAAIADSVAKAVSDEIPGSKVGSRLAGDDRYATSVAIADYMFTQAAKSSNYYSRLITPSTSTLHWMYFANGADNHVVDSMVGGALDNGPVMLVQPDGKIPEVVAGFIKKTLPAQFAALGGTAAVPDSTVQDAWVIKALANKWDSSYTIPKTKKDIDELKHLIKGKEGGTSNYTRSPDFMGVDDVVKQAAALQNAWGNRVATLRTLISDEFKHQNFKADPRIVYSTQMEGLLGRLYGDTIYANGIDLKTYLKMNDDNKTANGFDYEAFESTTGYVKVVNKAKDALEKWWATPDHQGTLADLVNPVAVASQVEPASVAGANMYQDSAAAVNSDTNQGRSGANFGVPLAAVTAAAKYTYENDVAWLADLNKQLAEAQQAQRAEIDKIAPKTELRLGGADRYETAQLIANQFGKLYGGEFNTGVSEFGESYIANSHRLADSLTAGQLTQGPIMLVKGDEKSMADVPEFTAKVATNLQCWTKNQKLGVYGIGGTAVLADTAIRSITSLINTKSVCAPESTAEAAKYQLAGTQVNAPKGTAAAGPSTVTIIGSKAIPSGLTITSILNAAGKDVMSATAAAGKIAWSATGNKVTFNIDNGIRDGAYTAYVKDADGKEGVINIYVGDTLTLVAQTGDADIVLAADTTAKYDVKLNGTADGTATCVTNLSGLTPNNAAGVVTVTATPPVADGTYKLTCTNPATGKTATADIIVKHEISAATVSADTTNTLSVANDNKPNGTFAVKLSRALTASESLDTATATPVAPATTTFGDGVLGADRQTITFKVKTVGNMVAGNTYTVNVKIKDATAVNSPLTATNSPLTINVVA